MVCSRVGTPLGTIIIASCVEKSFNVCEYYFYHGIRKLLVIIIGPKLTTESNQTIEEEKVVNYYSISLS